MAEDFLLCLAIVESTVIFIGHRLHNRCSALKQLYKRQLIQKGTESTQCKKKIFKKYKEQSMTVCLWNILTVCLNP